jgi:hypothetical protein
MKNALIKFLTPLNTVEMLPKFLRKKDDKTRTDVNLKCYYN